MKHKTYPDLVLAVSLTSSGMGYVIFEKSQTPLDWGIMTKCPVRLERRATAKMISIVEQCQPIALVLEDIGSKNSRHSTRLQRLSLRLAHVGESSGLAVYRYTRGDIRRAFAPLGAKTKPEIAEVIAASIHAFSHRKPPKRKIWMSEDKRQLLFDAAALGLTAFALVDSLKKKSL